jgi:membrane-associated protease RseP (regulator of RpoE activity)
MESLLLQGPPRPRERYLLHIGLFLATCITTVWAGGMWVGRTLQYGEDSYLGLITNLEFLADGAMYAVPLLLFLTAHEFGHYFAARFHRINVSLPYYIPLPLPPFFLNFGTFGAVIRIREPLRRTRHLFDVGVAGPLVGFGVALLVMVIALATLPPPSYIMDLDGHESLKAFVAQTGTFPDEPPPSPDGMPALYFGNTLLYAGLTALVADVPPMYEMYHYPVLLAGWLALLFTALNLLPVGQLDGGHVIYAMFGRAVHRVVARCVTSALLFSGLVGLWTAIWEGLRSMPPGSAEEVGSAAAMFGSATGAILVASISVFVIGYLLLLKILDSGQGAKVLGAAAMTTLVGLVHVIGIHGAIGFPGWILWVVLILFVIRLDHPPVLQPEPLTPARRAMGWACIGIFVLSFSIQPIYLVP